MVNQFTLSVIFTVDSIYYPRDTLAGRREAYLLILQPLLFASLNRCSGTI